MPDAESEMSPSRACGDSPDSAAQKLSRWLRAADRWVSKAAGSRRVRTLLVGSLIILTFAILAWNVYRDWDTLSTFDWRFDPWFLGASFLCYTAALSLGFLVWHQIMGRLGSSLDLRLDARLYLYSAASKRLPGFIWFVGSRLYLYRQEGVAATLTSVGILLEATWAILSGLLVFFGSLPFSKLALLPGGSPWFLLGTVPLLIVALQPSLLVRLINVILLRLGRPPLDLEIRRRDSLWWLVQHAAGWMAMGFLLYFLAWAIHPLPLSALPGVIGIVALTVAIRQAAFFIPGAWGIQELSLSLCLTPYLPLTLALGIPLLFRLWIIVSELSWVAACYLVCEALPSLTRK